MIKEFIFTLLIIESIGIDCPSKDVLSPCECLAGRWLTSHLICNGMNINETIISDIKTKLKLYNIEPYFDSITFTQTSIVRLDRDVFSSFTANNLSFFDNPKLEYIFIEEESKKIVDVFRIEKCISFKDSDILITVNKHFPNLTILELTQTGITEVPNNAFNLENSKLYQINLSSNQIKRLGINAFNLTHITEIDLSNNQLNQITNKNFIFNPNNNNKLIIDLQNNLLNERSFQNNCFNTFHTLILFLQNNQMRNLEETVFRPIAEGSNDNKIEVFGNPFLCDCNAKWIIDIDINLRNKIIKMNCGIRNIQEFTESDFKFCSPNTTTISPNITTSTINPTINPTINSTINSAINSTINPTINPTINSTTIDPKTQSTIAIKSTSPFITTSSISHSTITTTVSDPIVNLKNDINKQISSGTEIWKNIVIAVKKLENNSDAIRQELHDNISHLKDVEKKFDYYNNIYKDDFKITLSLQQSKDEIQNLIKTFVSINDKLSLIVNN